MRNLKNWMLAAILICGTGVFTACTSDNGDNPAPVDPEKKDAINYSQKSNWLQIPEITKEFDTFYILATEYVVSSYDEGASPYAAIDNPEMRQKAPFEYDAHASAFQDATNVFVPFYRQSGLKNSGDVWQRDGNIDAALSGIPYDDITGALDYYFEHYNQGRPFIIAGHSQGSAMCKLVLKKYF